jgi:hypothetical protein
MRVIDHKGWDGHTQGQKTVQAALIHNRTGVAFLASPARSDYKEVESGRKSTFLFFYDHMASKLICANYETGASISKGIQVRNDQTDKLFERKHETTEVQYFHTPLYR